MATTLNDTIDQGATFYRLVTLYTDEHKTIPMSLVGKTPRATLMTNTGLHIADFGCAVLNESEGTMAWTMARSATATLVPNINYQYNIDLDDVDGVTTDRALSGTITVRCGQVK